MVILAYDVSEMTALFDARKLAFHLDLKQLQYYEHELLAVSKIVGDDYSLLAVMPATAVGKFRRQLHGAQLPYLKNIGLSIATRETRVKRFGLNYIVTPDGAVIDDSSVWPAL